MPTPFTEEELTYEISPSLEQESIRPYEYAAMPPITTLPVAEDVRLMLTEAQLVTFSMVPELFSTTGENKSSDGSKAPSTVKSFRVPELEAKSGAPGLEIICPRPSKTPSYEAAETDSP